jgi:hypothetical protein
MLIYCDIDGTICHTEGGYDNSKPDYAAIAKINRLYDEGNIIIYWTARGKSTGIDWSELTRKQLKDWGCRFTELDDKTKPLWDLLLDDKTMRIEEL